MLRWMLRMLHHTMRDVKLSNFAQQCLQSSSLTTWQPSDVSVKINAMIDILE